MQRTRARCKVNRRFQSKAYGKIHQFGTPVSGPLLQRAKELEKGTQAQSINGDELRARCQELNERFV